MDNLILGLLAQAALKGSIVCVAAIGISLVVRRSAPAARHSLLFAALASFLLMPALGAVAPSYSVAPPVMLAAALSPGVSAETPGTLADAARAPTPADRPAAATNATQPPAPFPWQTVALAAWAAGAVLLLLRLGVGAIQARQIIRAAQPLTSSGPRVLESSRCLIPFTSGILHAVIVVPASLAREGGAALAAVLAHERAHARRHDALAGGVAWIICALFWFVPFAWMAFARLRLEQERACDEEGAIAFADRAGYAELLVRLGAAASRPAILSVQASGIRTLERRIRSLLESASPRVSQVVRSAVLLAALAVIVPLALMRCAPAPAKAAQVTDPELPAVRLVVIWKSGQATTAPDDEVTMMDFPMMWPLGPRSTGAPRLKNGATLSSGSDGAVLSWKSGAEVIAAGSGLVTEAASSEADGNYVRIRHPSGFESVYARLRDAPVVKAGDAVIQGQKIGVLGARLGYQLFVDGRSVDPVDVHDGRIEAVALPGKVSGVVFPTVSSVAPSSMTLTQSYATTSKTTVDSSGTIASSAVVSSHLVAQLSWPLRSGDGKITTTFGPAVNPFTKFAFFHEGIDIAWAQGTPVLAAQAGTVQEVGYDQTQGNFLRITGGEVESLYSHLSGSALQKGASVSVGQVIGTIGMTGMTTGPHVHFEVRWQGKLVNPLRLMTLTDYMKLHVGDW